MPLDWKASMSMIESNISSDGRCIAITESKIQLQWNIDMAGFVHCWYASFPQRMQWSPRQKRHRSFSFWSNLRYVQRGGVFAGATLLGESILLTTSMLTAVRIQAPLQLSYMSGGQINGVWTMNVSCSDGGNWDCSLVHFCTITIKENRAYLSDRVQHVTKCCGGSAGNK